MSTPYDIHKIDGLPFTNSTAMPHPIDLKRYQDDGLVCLDMDVGCFRLTSNGRARLFGGYGQEAAQ